jgi:hypothetical protein
LRAANGSTCADGTPPGRYIACRLPRYRPFDEDSI